MDYLSVDFLIKNEVVIPTIVAFLLFAYSSYKQTKAENEENFISLKQQFRETWGQIAVDKTLKAKNYEDCSSAERYQVFCVIDLLSQIYFLHGNSKGRFANQWRENINHVFSHKLMITGFHHFISQDQNAFSSKWLEYVQQVISKRQNENSDLVVLDIIP